MLLSAPPVYNFFNFGSLFFAVALLFTVGMILLVVFSRKKNANHHVKSFNKAFSSSFGYPVGVIVVGSLFLAGLNINLNYSESKFNQNLQNEISYQSSAAYGLNLSSETVVFLANVSSGVVGSENVGTIITEPFIDANNPGMVFKFQVSNSGAAKLLQSEYDFKEVPVKTDIINEEM